MTRGTTNTEGNTLFPDFLMPAHELCLLNHDVLVELLRSGEEMGVFSQRFRFKNKSDREAFEEADDVFSWFENTGRITERNDFIKRVVFPALLSDFLHFIFEALESSRKEKLSVAFALLRKPIQENLFLFEIIAMSPDKFATDLIENPLRLRARHAGGMDAHTNRISAILNIIGENDRFDANYLAQLRYQKTDDGFDGICNKATHLFTQHKAILTESLNINFIFSGKDAHSRQWYYLYSRLPYLLFYARRLIEHICSTFITTDPDYLANIENRIMAGTLLWAPNIEKTYKHPKIDKFVDATLGRLNKEYTRHNSKPLIVKELPEILETGILQK